MHPPKQLGTAMAEIVAVADEEMDAESPNEHTAKWIIIPPKCGERESAAKMKHNPAIKTETTNNHSTITVSLDTSRLIASTSTVPGIHATKSIQAQRPYRLLQQEIVTRSE
jgi:hypothetical protein